MSFVPGQENAGSRSSSVNRAGNGILKKTTWADQTERGPNNQNRGRRNQPKQTATTQPNSGSVVPHYSWFSGITQFQKGKEFQFAQGQGVPIANGIPASEQKGYWYRHNRRSFKTPDGQQKQLLPRWYFYYLGTGPHAGAEYGDDIDGVVWVASQQADTKTTADIVERDPSSHEAIPTRFAPGTVLPQGFYVEGSGRSAPASRSGSRSQSRGPNNRARSSSNQRQPASTVKPDMAEEIAALVLAKLGKDAGQPKQVTKQSAKEVRQKILNKPRQKRTPNKQCPVQQCFGKRGPNQNFGGSEMLKLGTSDPQFPILAELAPTPSAFFFGSKLELVKKNSGGADDPTKDVYELQYSGAIRFDSTLPGFETIMKVLNENLDAYQDQAGGADVVSPKPQRKRGTKQKALKGEVDNVSVAKPKSSVQRNVSRELTPEDRSLLAQILDDGVVPDGLEDDSNV
ncbi:nucleocapsid protein [Murine coronavirus MHV-1]|uniref:Nucleoprotein n=3 Tax=Murine hepatitis virus TaxID=11138 RepID=NCAP_CVM1|nr:RecName: Full=Nucleoprotein; AltName: Full=Nucleocapsid protein; Short=NC; Short=Protein N [Murine hepatitis virus strain 1]AAA46439.1 hepatitis virus nucleocapsid (N-MHV1) ORF 1 [Murine hepatitis virus]ABS87269.1 nucleocapsid protein [Murine hepatitis virus]ACN89735.1 nucleocapsid protein [Murine coronavirus MHV-1]